MWSPSCILEQRCFQPAIVCKTRVLLIASATVRFAGVAILGSHRRACPLGSFKALIAPARLYDGSKRHLVVKV
jgi:hypothetical protein